MENQCPVLDVLGIHAGFPALHYNSKRCNANRSARRIGRKRFGPDAYWRQTANLMGTWHAIGMKQRSHDADMRTTDLPLASLTFREDRGVTAVLAGGRIDSTYQWFLKNQYIWLRARGDNNKRSEAKEIPLEFRGQQFSIAWPDSNAKVLLVFQRVSE
jgi:hypothetical protein